MISRSSVAAIRDIMRGSSSDNLPRLMVTELTRRWSGRSFELHVSVVRLLLTDVIEPNTTDHHAAEEDDGDGTWKIV